LLCPALASALLLDLKIKMATNGAPDSWDDGEDMNDKMAALNVDAPSFVPNVNAAVFVPSFLPAAAAFAPAPTAAPVPSSAPEPTKSPVHTVVDLPQKKVVK